jgi:competence protein ComEA
MSHLKIVRNGVLALALAFAMSSGVSTVYAAPEAKASAQAPVNLNQASAEELIALKGIGPKMAERIIAYRKEHGPFKTVDQIVQVKGIGNAKFQKLKDQVTV